MPVTEDTRTRAAIPPDPHQSGRALFGAVRVTGLVTLASRLGGLARDVLLGRIFGDTALNSAFAAGFAVPNMFRRLFGEGALSAAFIPEYTAALKADPTTASRYASLVLLVLAGVTGVLTAVIEVVLLWVLFQAPHDADRTLSIHLVMVMLPFMPLICIAAILAGMLQVHGRFGPAASGPLILNGFIIAVGLWHLAAGTLADRQTAYILGIATVLSGLTQAAWFLRLLRPHIRWRFLVRTGDADERIERTLRRFVPVMVGLGTLQLNAFVDMLIAMWPIWVGPTVLGFAYPLDASSNGILALTQRLYQFPLGVFGIAVATAVFPLLAKHADEPEHFLQTLRRGLRLSLFIGLPASVGLILVREPITYTFFGGGRSGFSDEGVARSAAVLLGHASGIWAYSLNHVFTRAFYAKGDTRTPMKVALWMVALNLSLNLGLIWPYREAGLAWATSISAAVQCAVLAFLCRRLLHAPLFDRETSRAAVKITAATVLMTAVVLLTRRLTPPAPGWTGHAAALGLLCFAGGISYLFVAVLLRIHELRWLVRAK